MLLSNNLDVGPDSTTITTALSDDLADTPFDSVSSAGTGVVCVYRTAVNRPTARGFVGEFSTGNGNGANTPSCTWSTAFGQQTHIYSRFYLKFNAAPLSGADSPIFLLQHGAANLFSFGVSAANNLNFRIKEYISSGGTTDLNVYTIELGVWIRVELEAYVIDPGTPAEQWGMNAYLFTGDMVDTDTVVDSNGIGASGFPNQSFMDTVSIGYPVAHKNYTAVQIAGWVVSDAGFIGAAPLIPEIQNVGPAYSL
jgi:hypothetical protein